VVVVVVGGGRGGGLHDGAAVAWLAWGWGVLVCDFILWGGGEGECLEVGVRDGGGETYHEPPEAEAPRWEQRW